MLKKSKLIIPASFAIQRALSLRDIERPIFERWGISAATRVPVSTKLGFPRGVTKRSDINIGAPAILDFSKDTAFVLDPSLLQNNVDGMPVLGMFVDNSANPTTLLITTGVPIGEPIAIPPLSQARLPIETGQPAIMAVTTTTPGQFTGKVTIILLNYVPAPLIWYVGQVPTGPKQAVPLGYIQETLTDAAAHPLAPGANPAAAVIPAGANNCLITVEGAAVRWRDDGTAPTAAIGMPLGAGSSIQFTENLSLIKFIQQAGNVTLDVSFYA